MEYSIKVELIALLIIAILALFHHDKNAGCGLRYQLFSICLAASEVTILVDTASTLALTYHASIPLSLNIALATLYFIVLYFTFSIMAVYSFYIMFEHASNKHCLHIALCFISLLGGILLMISIANLRTGWLFTLRDGLYIRGPLNWIGYLILTIELCMLIMCYVRNRKTVSRSTRRVIFIFPPLVALMTLFQQTSPGILMNGMLAALANTILFICFQNSRISQDPLTGLQNRSSFFQELSMLLKQHSRFHIILIYLDHFDTVNQKYNVARGDTLLYSVARYLEHFSAQYRAFRFGNTQFILMGAYDSETEAGKQAVLVQQRFQKAWKTGDVDCLLDACFADIICDDGERNEAQIIDQLEYALKCAKDNGKGRLVHFNEYLNEELKRKKYVLEQVKRALSKDSFQVYYQPIYQCGKYRFCSAESLLRLRDEEGNSVSPAEFIPLAEENGLIDSISWIVIKKVCLFLGENPALALDSVSINLSMQQLADPCLAERILSCLEEYHVPPEKIKIEITERVIAEEPELVCSAMTHLIDKSIHFYLDDFGVGYSNLAGVLSLPFETIKLDASLISGIDTSEMTADTIRLLVQMLHRSGHIVVAEGIETEAQVKKARELEIDRIQGYYYAKPMPEQELIAFLGANLPETVE